MTQREPSSKETWWAAFIRVVSFGVGVYILLGQSQAAVEKPYLIGAAIVCMGPLAVGLSGDLITAFRDRGKL